MDEETGLWDGVGEALPREHMPGRKEGATASLRQKKGLDGEKIFSPNES